MPLNEFESVDGNAVNIQALVQQVRSPRGVVPFVGAGMSVPFGFPQWKDFLLGQAHSPALRARVQQGLDAGAYEGAAEALLQALGADTFQSAVDLTFAMAPHATVAPDAPVRQLTRLCAGPIVTTNFDRVLEAVFSHAGNPFD